MDWGDERFVKYFTRDTPDFLVLSLEAQGLIGLVMRKLDRAGVLDLGKQGARGVAIAIGHPQRWKQIELALTELLDDGCFRLVGNKLVMPNFLEAQHAVQCGRLRQEESRARRRDIAAAVGDGILVDTVTLRDIASRDVTECHEVKRAVTNGHSDADTDTDTIPEDQRSDAPHLNFSSTAAPKGGGAVTKRDEPSPPGLPRLPGLPQEPPKAKPARTAQANLPGAATEPPAASPAKRAENGRRHPETQQAIDGFHAMFVAWSGGSKPRWKPPQIGMITDLMNAVGSAAEVLARARVMFETYPNFPAEHPDLGTLVAHWDKFVRPPNGAGGPRVGQGRVATAEELGPSGDRRF